MVNNLDVISVLLENREQKKQQIDQPLIPA